MSIIGALAGNYRTSLANLHRKGDSLQGIGCPLESEDRRAAGWALGMACSQGLGHPREPRSSDSDSSLLSSLSLFLILSCFLADQFFFFFFGFFVYMADNDYRKAPEIVANWKQSQSQFFIPSEGPNLSSLSQGSFLDQSPVPRSKGTLTVQKLEGRGNISEKGYVRWKPQEVFSKVLRHNTTKMIMYEMIYKLAK